MITLTPRAVVKALTLAKKEGKPPILRVGVKGGGCSGMSYVLDFIHEINENDVVEAIRSSRSILVDEKTIITPSAKDLAEQNRVFVYDK